MIIHKVRNWSEKSMGEYNKKIRNKENDDKIEIVRIRLAELRRGQAVTMNQNIDSDDDVEDDNNKNNKSKKEIKFKLLKNYSNININKNDNDNDSKNENENGTYSSAQKKLQKLISQMDDFSTTNHVRRSSETDLGVVFPMTFSDDVVYYPFPRLSSYMIGNNNNDNINNNNKDNHNKDNNNRNGNNNNYNKDNNNNNNNNDNKDNNNRNDNNNNYNKDNKDNKNINDNDNDNNDEGNNNDQTDKDIDIKINNVLDEENSPLQTISEKTYDAIDSSDIKKIVTDRKLELEKDRSQQLYRTSLMDVASDNWTNIVMARQINWEKFMEMEQIKRLKLSMKNENEKNGLEKEGEEEEGEEEEEEEEKDRMINHQFSRKLLKKTKNSLINRENKNNGNDEIDDDDDDRNENLNYPKTSIFDLNRTGPQSGIDFKPLDAVPQPTPLPLGRVHFDCCPADTPHYYYVSTTSYV